MNEEQKIAEIERARKRIKCLFCSLYVYNRHVCKTPERAAKCTKLHPKPKPIKIPPRTRCPYCNKDCGSYHALGGHMISCKSNPKSEERNRKISISRTGLHHSEETRKKISISVSKSLSMKNDETIAIRILPTGKDEIKIKLKFF